MLKMAKSRPKNSSKKPRNERAGRTIDPFWGVVITALCTLVGAMITAFATMNSSGASGSHATPTPAPYSSNASSYTAFGTIGFSVGKTKWYLDVGNGMSGAGTPVTVWDNDRKSTGKQWYFYPVDPSDPGAGYVIVNGFSQEWGGGLDGKMVLNYDPQANSLTLEKFRAKDLQQEWSVDSGELLHSSAASGACLFHGRAVGTKQITQTVGVQRSCGENSSVWNIPDNL